MTMFNVPLMKLSMKLLRNSQLILLFSINKIRKDKRKLKLKLWVSLMNRYKKSQIVLTIISKLLQLVLHLLEKLVFFKNTLKIYLEKQHQQLV